MKLVSIAVDVSCSYTGTPPVYRVFVDSELLTERSFIWDSSSQYVREHIQVNLAPGVHWLSIEHPDESAVFAISNIQVDGVAVAAKFYV